MKKFKFRVVPDKFAGFEAQVKYAWFPFAWFQLNDYNGVNTWSTEEEAEAFIEIKRSGQCKGQRTSNASNYQLEFKSFLKTGISRSNNPVWHERFIIYLIGKRDPDLVAGLMLAEAR